MDELYMNRALKAEIEEWCAAHGASAPAMPEPSAPPPPAPSAPADNDPCPWQRYNIPQMEYDHIFAQFLTFDTDGSGHLDMDECQRCCGER